MKNIISLFILLLLFSKLSYSQINNKSVQLLVRGTITDKIDNNPIQVEVRFEDPFGKSFKISSNSLTGKFEQILSSNTQYKVRLFSSNIFPTEFILTTPDVQKYAEIEQNYQIIRLEPGRTVLAYDLFPNGKADLNEDIKKFIDDLNIKMRFNRNVKINIEVLGTDSRDNFNKTVEKKIKKKTVTEKSFNKSGFEDLIHKRYNQINATKSKLSYNERISISYNNNINISDQFLSDCPNCDLRVIVTEFDPNLK